MKNPPIIILRSGLSGLSHSSVNVEITIEGFVPQKELFAEVQAAVANYGALVRDLKDASELFARLMASPRNGLTLAEVSSVNSRLIEYRDTLIHAGQRL